MTLLYNELAFIYDSLYNEIFDYHEQYREYHSLLKKYKRKSLLEIACGTGNLAGYFQRDGYDYIGMDISKGMIDIARKKNPDLTFILGNMVDFNLDIDLVDSVIVTGKSISHIIKKDDIVSALTCIKKILGDEGILIFDCFDSDTIFDYFPETLRQNLKLDDGREIEIINKNTMIDRDTPMWRWNAEYHISTESDERKIYHDIEIFRAYGEKELVDILEYTGYITLESRKRADTLMMVSKSK